MAECGVIVDHSTLHHWVIRLMPLLDTREGKAIARSKGKLQGNNLNYLKSSKKSCAGFMKPDCIASVIWLNCFQCNGQRFTGR